jgi:hypothetical protein
MKIKRNFSHSGNKRTKVEMFQKALNRKQNLVGSTARSQRVNRKGS